MTNLLLSRELEDKARRRRRLLANRVAHSTAHKIPDPQSSVVQSLNAKFPEPTTSILRF